MSTTTSQSPFLDMPSFRATESGAEQESTFLPAPARSPFLSVYELADQSPSLDPHARERAIFLNELYDHGLNEALLELATDAARLHEAHHSDAQGESHAPDHQCERFLARHFEPLAQEIESLFEALESQWSTGPANLSERQVEEAVDGYRPASRMSPAFENFFGSIGGFIKKIGKKAVGLAKKGIALVGNLALGPILAKLKQLVRPLLQKVIRYAIGRLPIALQPIARKLAERLPLGEVEQDSSEVLHETTPDISQIQHEFNEQVANVLFAPDEVSQESEVAQAISQSRSSSTDVIAELDTARDRFIQRMQNLKEQEDPTPEVENFIPAILPALKLGIHLAGRPRVVNFLAQLVGKLIARFVGPQYTPPLSRALVDAGLHLIHLEATPQDEAQAAGSAVAAAIEETVRRVASLPDNVLDNQELLEAFALEAFEQAAAANLPPVLSEEAYRLRPDLREARTRRGAWLFVPLRGPKRCKRYSQLIRTKLTPQKAEAVVSFGGSNLSEILSEQYDVAPGSDVEVELQLFETIPGTPAVLASQYGRSAGETGAPPAPFHPLTPEAAGLLLDEPRLGREVESEFLIDPLRTKVGQRFYSIGIPGRRRLTAVGPGRLPRHRQHSRVGLVFDFPGNQIRVRIHLGERRAQGLAVKLRQQGHVGMVVSNLQTSIQRGLHAVLIRHHGHLRMIHDAVVPGQWHAAIRRLSSTVSHDLLHHVRDWTITGLADFFKSQAAQFITATEDPADGVTIVVTITSPPGMAELRDAFKGPRPAGELKFTGAAPNVSVTVAPGHPHE